MLQGKAVTYSREKGIQSNSRDGYEDEIFGELTIAELTGGLNVCKVTDWFVR